MAPWLRVLEAYLVQALLRTPAFHRGVEKVVRGVHRARHGIPPGEMGGTKLDQPGSGGFLKHFSDEVQTQLGRAEAKGGEAGPKRIEEAIGGDAETVWRSSRMKAEQKAEQKVVEEGGADVAWEKARQNTEQGAKQGFIGEYIAALREQARGGKEWGWDWVITYPNDVIGVAKDTFMTLVISMGLYCVIIKDGPGAGWPGSPGFYTKCDCFTSSTLHAHFNLWAALERWEKAGSQGFKIHNGDVESWQNLSPKLAKEFGLKIPKTMFRESEQAGI